VHSSVVSLCGIRLLTFIAELNDLEVWATDIGNAYLTIRKSSETSLHLHS